MKAPAVSIITPLYNAAAFLRETLESLLAQTFTDFELLVIDDGSTDDGPEIARGINDSRIRLLATKGNRGPAAARNIGLDEARAEFVAFADADDPAKPERLTLQIAALDAEPRLGFVGSRVEVIDQGGRSRGTTWGFEGHDEDIPPLLLFRNVLATSTMVFRRSSIGGARFRTDLAVASDYELWTRLARTTSGRVLPNLLVKYRDHPGNLTHQRSVETERCLREIASSQLRELGIEPTDDELSLHRKLAASHECSREFVERSENWLCRIRESARSARCFELRALEVVLAQIWSEISLAAAGLGWWMWRRHRRSSLRRPASPGLLLRTTRGEVKQRLAPMLSIVKGGER